jgi:CubicO group peptidase (beta-lactamase class C family)
MQALLTLLAVGLPVLGEGRTDPATYAEAAARTARTLDAFRSESGIPGLAFAIGVDGVVVWSGASGWADRERRIPARTDTRFRIASLSKPMTAACLARLAERGAIDLDAPVQDYVPSFPDKDFTITARMLAGHVSGIRHNRREEVWNTEQPHYDTLLEALEMFRDDPLVGRPESVWSYSTPAYTLLGAAMEAASGLAYPELMEREVFDVLGMPATIPDDPRAEVPLRCAFYVTDDDRVVPSPYMDHSYKLPAGGYLSTVADLVRFGSALLEPGFLEAETLRTVFTTMKLADGTETGYGMGWNLEEDYAGRATYQHGGNQPGARAQLLIWPQERVVATFLCNVRGAPVGSDEVWLMARPFFDALSGGGEVDPAPAESAVGVYELEWSKGYGETPGVRVTITDELPTLRGWVDAPNLRTYRIAEGDVRGDTVWLSAVHPLGLLQLRFELDGRDALGHLLIAEDTGAVRGRRVPSLHEARALSLAGRGEECRDLLEQLVDLTPDDGRAWYALSEVYSDLNEFGPCADALANAAERGWDPPGSLAEAASMWARCGQKGLALDALERAVAAGYDDLERRRSGGDFGSLRDEPRFVALLGER